MSALRLTHEEWTDRVLHPTKDERYKQETALGPAIEGFLAWKKLSRRAPRTLDQYERDCARLAWVVPGKSVAEIEAPDLMLALTAPVGGRGPIPERSWHRCRAAWRGLFDWSMKFGHRPAGLNPVDLLPAMRPEPMRIYNVFTVTEQAKLVKAQADSLLPVRDRLGALIFQELGVRKNEARWLRPKDFDMASRVVIVLGKGDKERAIPFSEEMYWALMTFMDTPIPRVRMKDRDGRWQEERLPTPTDFIFFPAGVRETYGQPKQLLWTDPTKPMGVGSMHRWWQRCVERSGIEYRSLHMNRHTVGTLLVDAEVDAFTVRDWLGHADTRTTEVYVHNSRKRLRKAADRLRMVREVGNAEEEES